MKEELFAVSQFCIIHNIDPSFVNSLESEGLITITFSDQEKYIEEGQLHELEAYTRWHQDLGINLEGIDAIRNLLQKVSGLQHELHELKERLKQYEGL